MAVYLLAFFVVQFLFHQAHGALEMENYCSINTYNRSETYMHFTKEATFEEFSMVGKFKALHCCAKGYRSIEWMKDGKPYPWALSTSGLILYDGSANQTIYTRHVAEADAGNYTCVLKNDTVVHSHTVHLRVFEKVPDDPKITYISPDTDTVLGQGLRLFCEAFAGQVDLPDAYNEVEWRRVRPNGTIYDVPPHAVQLKVTRETGQTFATYLLIQNVQKEDFGEYVCMISNPGNRLEKHVTVREKVEEQNYLNPNPVPVGKMILIMSAILFVVVAIIILYIQYGLKVQVHIKDTFTHLEENDGKSNDVLIAYSSNDSDIALGVLMETLEKRYNYKCKSKELPPNISSWYSNLQVEAQKSRRIIVVFSPAAINGKWDPTNVQQALKQLQSLDTKLICVSLKTLPKNQNEVKDSHGDTLTSLTHSIGVIVWERKQDDKFWYSLRLRLPARRKTECEETKKLTQGENNLRLNSDSQESLDNLV